MKKEKTLDKVLDELSGLYIYNFEKYHDIIDSFSLTYLEQLALHYYSIHPNFEKPFSCEVAPDVLGSLMFRRRGFLNNSFKETPQNITRYLLINDHVNSCVHNVELEVKRITNRFKNNEIKFMQIRLEPLILDTDSDLQTNKLSKDMNDLLQKMLPEISCPRTPPLCGCWADSHANSCGINPDKLNGAYVCYAMHELWDHTCWSLPDILRINCISVTIDVEDWHYEEYF
ncbi:MAG: hypothetical protein Ta2F_17580 [Termitinemataceae bacterium]|nr:MAG: hypothetical protein Ta2F_17580 [Termitinemataceae bacterium]